MFRSKLTVFGVQCIFRVHWKLTSKKMQDGLVYYFREVIMNLFDSEIALLESQIKLFPQFPDYSFKVTFNSIDLWSLIFKIV